jgi:hypothetical protein
LPSTCEPEGYIREKEKGNIKEIPGGGSVTFNIRAGYLDRKETETMKEFIEKIAKDKTSADRGIARNS